MDSEHEIKSPDELNFIVFCIENNAIRLKADPRAVYDALAKKRILQDYLIPTRRSCIPRAKTTS